MKIQNLHLEIGGIYGDIKELDGIRYINKIKLLEVSLVENKPNNSFVIIQT